MLAPVVNLPVARTNERAVSTASGANERIACECRAGQSLYDAGAVLVLLKAVAEASVVTRSPRENAYWTANPPCATLPQPCAAFRKRRGSNVFLSELSSRAVGASESLKLYSRRTKVERRVSFDEFV